MSNVKLDTAGQLNNCARDYVDAALPVPVRCHRALCALEGVRESSVSALNEAGHSGYAAALDTFWINLLALLRDQLPPCTDQEDEAYP